MRLKLNFYALIVFLSVISISCKDQRSGSGMTLSQTDSYYSDLSVKKGRNAAFMAMFDSTGVMLVSQSMPVVGQKKISDHLLSRSDTSYILSWKPMFATEAQSGELGYTYGTYKVTNRSSGALLEEGTYATCWKKDDAGHWKAVLDTGNEGLKVPKKDN